MAKKQTVVEQTEQFDETAVLAYIVQDEQGDFHVKDAKTGEVGPSCKFCDEGDKTIVLTPNRANRKWFNRKKAQEAIDAGEEVPLYYKASRHIGTSNKVPNAKMMEWAKDNMEGGAALYEEYMAIVARAMAARDEAKAKPLTEKEKLEAKVAKAKAAYEKLLAQAAGTPVEE